MEVLGIVRLLAEAGVVIGQETRTRPADEAGLRRRGPRAADRVVPVMPASGRAESG
jgi:hypothetical protein